MVRYPLINQHAVVLDAGLDGLLTARVLVDYFSAVTVVTAGTLPAEPALPQDVWQALPAHVLAVQGYRNLERLFPGLTAELMVARAPTVEWTADAPLLLPGGWGPRFHSDLISRPVTLNLLLHLIRKRLIEYSGDRITFLEQRQIAGLEHNPALSGVRLHRQDDRTLETLPADLVVDAAGRRTQLPDWLLEAGYPLPQQTINGQEEWLAVGLYRRPPGFQPGWQALVILPQPGSPGAVLMPVEQGHWLVMLTGCDGDPPHDRTRFLDAARELPTPALYEAIRHALPLTPVFSLSEASAVRWHFERLLHWPDHLLVTGVAAFAFYPALGLDLTAATLAALILREALEEQRKQRPDGGLAGLHRRFQSRLSRSLALNWRILCAGERDDRVARLTRRYVHGWLAAACSDTQMLHNLLLAAGLVVPLRSLMKPALLRQSLRPAAESGVINELPPAFEPERVHKTITQELAAVARLEDP